MKREASIKGFAFRNQPLSSTDIARWIAFILVTTFLSGCSQFSNNGPRKPGSKTGIANPASVHCVNKGGSLSIQKRDDGGEYGICILEDNRQCEEWALFRGECPDGGRKIAGYVTPSARYCVITGGSYTVTGQSRTDKEQGICTFNSGKSCDVWDYYGGRCSNLLP